MLEPLVEPLVDVGRMNMKRCVDCGAIVYGDDKVCTACRTNEWRDMHASQLRKAVDDCNAEYWRKKRLARDLYEGLGFAVLAILLALFIANIPNAMRYEKEKLNHVRQLTGK